MNELNKNLLKEVISHVNTQFKVNQHDKVVLVEGADESLSNMVRQAHCIAQEQTPIWPSNFVYETIYRVLAECENANSIDELESIIVEPEVYNHDLLTWLSSNQVRSSYFDEALSDLTSSPDNPPDLFTTLSYAQSLEIEYIKGVVVNYIEEEVEYLLNNENEVEV